MSATDDSFKANGRFTGSLVLWNPTRVIVTLMSSLEIGENNSFRYHHLISVSDARFDGLRGHKQQSEYRGKSIQVIESSSLPDPVQKLANSETDLVCLKFTGSGHYYSKGNIVFYGCARKTQDNGHWVVTSIVLAPPEVDFDHFNCNERLIKVTHVCNVSDAPDLRGLFEFVQVDAESAAVLIGCTIHFRVRRRHGSKATTLKFVVDKETQLRFDFEHKENAAKEDEFVGPWEQPPAARLQGIGDFESWEDDASGVQLRLRLDGDAKREPMMSRNCPDPVGWTEGGFLPNQYRVALNAVRSYAFESWMFIGTGRLHLLTDNNKRYTLKKLREPF